MKRLALVAALAVLPAACTTVHQDRRVLTDWNLDLIKDTGRERPKAACDYKDWDGVSNPIIKWVLVEPFACAMLPISWLGDTLVLNPINGFQKAELQVYNRRFGEDEERGVGEAADQNYQLAPLAPPPMVSDAFAVPEFLGHWIWNSTYWTAPVNKDSWNKYWNEHHEASSQ
jgi:hypothetical protein